MPSLLLNATWEPVRIVSSQRAVLLIVMGDAESVEDSDQAFHSAGGLVVPVPSVLRLTSYKRIPTRARIPVTRRNVLARDKGRCAYCGGSASTIDHVVPRSRGGRHTWTNVVAACVIDNSRKDDRLLSEIGWSLPVKPWEPPGRAWVTIAAHDAPMSWAPYLRDAG